MKYFSLSNKIICLASLLMLLILSGCQDKKSPESRLENPYLEVKIGNSVYTKLDVYNQISEMIGLHKYPSKGLLRWPKNTKIVCWLGIDDKEFEKLFLETLNILSSYIQINVDCSNESNKPNFNYFYLHNLKDIFDKHNGIGRILIKKGFRKEAFIKEYEKSTYGFIGVEKDNNSVISGILNISHIYPELLSDNYKLNRRLLITLYSGLVPPSYKSNHLKESIFSNNEYLNYQPFDIALLKAWYSNKITPGMSLDKAPIN